MPCLRFIRAAMSRPSRNIINGVTHRRPMIAIVISFTTDEIRNDINVTIANEVDDQDIGQRLLCAAIQIIDVKKQR